MLTCINKFLVKVKGSVIYRHVIQFNEVAMTMNTDDKI